MIAKPVSKVSKKQQQIVDTAKELFFRHGTKRVTIGEICQKAGVSKMTFYRNFANKNELAKHIIHRTIDEAYAKLDEVQAMEIPFTEKLQLMLSYKLEFVEKMSSDYIEEYMHMVQGTLLQQWFERVMQFLTDGQERGEIRSEIRPEFIIYIIDKLTEIVEDKRIIQLYPSYIEFTKEVWNFFYYGIIARSPTEVSDEGTSSQT